MRAIVDRIEDVAESLRAEYEPHEGKYVLKIDGSPFGYVRAAEHQEVAAKLAEFRDNNRSLNSLKAELETKLKSFEGIDPAEHKALKQRIAELEQRGVKGGDDVSQIVKQAVESAVNPVRAELETMKAQKAEADAKLAAESLKTKFIELAQKIGVDERAVQDFLARGSTVFQFIDGKVVARNGDTPIFSKKHPGEMLTLEEWGAEVQKEAPHLFKPSKGAGSNNPFGVNTGAPAGGPRRTITSDPLEFGKNLEAIAKGEVIVRD